MDIKEILEQLPEMLDRNVKLFQKEWLQMSHSTLVDIDMYAPDQEVTMC